MFSQGAAACTPCVSRTQKYGSGENSSGFVGKLFYTRWFITYLEIALFADLGQVTMTRRSSQPASCVTINVTEGDNVAS